MALQLLDRTEWIRVDDRSAAAAFLDRRWRLPTCARTYAFHGLATHGALDPRLVDMLRPLQGKFTVVNDAVVVPLPVAAHRRAVRLVAAASDRARRQRRSIVITLAEEQRPIIRHDVASGGAPGDPGPEVRFAADLRYRLTVTLGDRGGDDRDAARDDEARDSRSPETARISRAWPWFDIPVLVPDADALHLMAAATRQLYRAVTGRQGPGSHDSYWYADSWERYHEPGRMAGCIQPLAVACAAGRESGPPAQARPGADGDDDAFLYGGLGSAERSRWTDYSAATQHRLFVPPGYCLVRFSCWVELALEGGSGRQIR